MEYRSKELLRRVQAGESVAAAQLFADYVPRLRALVQSKLSGLMLRRFDSDDIVQSAMRSFFVRAADGDFCADQSGDLWRLLAAITMRKLSRAATYHRAAKRDVNRDESFDPERSGQISARTPTPADAAEAAEELIWIMRCVSVRPVCVAVTATGLRIAGNCRANWLLRANRSPMAGRSSRANERPLRAILAAGTLDRT